MFTDDDDETGLTPAHDAATLVIFHEAGDGGAPRLLMVVRSRAMAFAAGAAVFPGGRVDPDDHAIAAATAPDMAAKDAAARVAAIRETLEETGLGLGIVDHGGDEALSAIREGLLQEQPFSALLADHGARLDLDGLIPFARWRPNFAHARVFDTRFYLAQIKGPAPPISIQSSENSRYFWSTAQETLARADEGEISIIFPTRRNLERLATFAGFDEAVQATRNVPVRRITPWVDLRDGARHLCIRDDCGYPVVSEPIDGAMRG